MHQTQFSEKSHTEGFPKSGHILLLYIIMIIFIEIFAVALLYVYKQQNKCYSHAMPLDVLLYRVQLLINILGKQPLICPNQCQFLMLRNSR